MRKEILTLTVTMICCLSFRTSAHVHQASHYASRADHELKNHELENSDQVIQQLKEELAAFEAVGEESELVELNQSEEQEDHLGIFSKIEGPVEKTHEGSDEDFDHSLAETVGAESQREAEIEAEIEDQEWSDQFLRLYYEIEKESEERKSQISDRLPNISYRDRQEIEGLLDQIANFKRRRGSGVLAAGRSCVSRGGRRCRVVQNLGVWRANNGQRCKKGRAKYSCHLVGKAVDFRVSKGCNIGRIGSCSRGQFGFFKNYGGGQIHIGPGSCKEARRLPMPRACGGKKVKKSSKKKKVKKRGKRSKRKNKKRRRRGRRR